MINSAQLMAMMMMYWSFLANCIEVGSNSFQNVVRYLFPDVLLKCDNATSSIRNGNNSMSKGR